MVATRTGAYRAMPLAAVLVSALAILVAASLAPSGLGRSTRAQGGAPTAGTAEDASLGAFDKLPRFPKSEPLGPARATASTVVRDFETVGATPAVVVEFYLDALVGWRSVRQHSTATAWSGHWIADAHELTIDVFVSGDGSAGERTRYRIALHDR